jgi:hypothetical protein
MMNMISFSGISNDEGHTITVKVDCQPLCGANVEIGMPPLFSASK